MGRDPHTPEFPGMSHPWRKAEKLVSAGINRHGVTNGRVVKKGLATHLETESCEGGRKAALEALTGAYAGWVLSSEIGNSGSRRCQLNRKAIRRRAPGRVRRHPAETETPGMHRNSMRENRETPGPPAAGLGGPMGESEELEDP